MFGTLLESRAKRQRRAGSSIASIVIHTAVIGGAVMMTARETIDATPVATRTILILPVLRDPPPPRRTTVAPVTGTVAAPPSAYVVRMPLVVPVDIPPIDLTATPTPIGFDVRSMTRDVLTCGRNCGTGTPSDSSGNALWSANDVMMRLRDDPIAPRYPEALRRAGIEGTVVVKFAVDTTGRVDMRSIEVVRSTHEAFTVAVRESLEKLRFNPSMVGERRVRALAMMPFQFTLRY